ncbi:MAG: type I secretion system permease/ATPase [Parvularculaceae bacterium]|nr:type I secretion system permease/ATPase [Parvularculaceae bacterium]
MAGKGIQISEEMRAGVAAARPLVTRAAIFSAGVNLLMLTGPLYMLQLYDRVLSSRSLPTLAVLTLLIVGLYAGMGLLDFVRTALVSRAAARFDARLADSAFNAAVEGARYSGGQAGDAPLKDLRTIRQAIGSSAITAFFDAPFAPLYLLIVFMLHWALGLTALAGAAALIAMAIVNERASRKSLADALESGAAGDAAMAAILRNASATDAMGMRGAVRRMWFAHSSKSIASNAQAADFINIFGAATKASRMFLQSLILGVGALLVIAQQTTPGVMIAASIITGRALAPIEMAIGQWRVIGAAIAAWKRLSKFLDAAPGRAEKISLPAPSGNLKLSRVFVQPALAKKPIVKGVTLDLAPGEAIGIIGPSGAGKSTLARAMVGVERVVAGEVRLDGADLLAWPREDVGRFIGYLPQETELFSGTVAQNIARFDDSASDDEIVAAAQAAGAYELVLNLPDGFETEVGDRGFRLSVGQRQRVGLARALFREPTLIVLDEPNSNLDSEGEVALSNAILTAKRRGAALVVVAHRPSAIAHVDRLLLLTDGEARAYGPRDEVLAKIAPGVASIGAKKPQETGQNDYPSRSNA